MTANLSIPVKDRSILFLSYWFPPENESGALRPYRFCKYLTRYGYIPSVVAAPLSASHDNSALVLRTAASEKSQSLSEAVWRFVQRIAPYNDRLEWVPRAYALSAKLLRDGGMAFVMSTSPPVATHVVALMLRRRFRFRWVADFRDPMLGNPFRTHPIGLPYDRALERCIVHAADAVVVNTDVAQEALAERYPRSARKILTIWNGYDPEGALAPREMPARARKAVAHFGSIYGGRQPGLLLDSFSRLIRQGRIEEDDFTIRLVGSIDRSAAWLRSDSARYLLARNVLEYKDETVPREVAVSEMAETEYLLLLDLNEKASGVQVPAKLFEYIQIGRPILAITSRHSPVERILRRAEVPHVCLYVDDPQNDLDHKLQRFLALPTNPVSASPWFKSEFDASRQAGALAHVLEATRGEQEPGVCAK